MRKVILWSLALITIVAVAAGCQRASDNARKQADQAAPPPAADKAQPGEPAAPPASTAEKARPADAPGGVPADEPPRTPGAAAPTAPRWREVTVPAGTVLPLRLDEAVGSDRSRVEETVTATLAEGITVDGVTAVPAGSRVLGTVTRARRAGRVKGVAELAIRFDTLDPKGADTQYRMQTAAVSRRAATTRKKDALGIGAPAAGGALVGALLGGKKGALVGGAVGGGAGSAVVLSTRGKDVRLPRGAALSIRLLEPLTVRVPA